MLNKIIGVATVFAFTAILFLLRHLILTVGKPKAKRSRAARSRAAKERLRPSDSRDEREDETSRAESVIPPSHSWNIPRFRM